MRSLYLLLSCVVMIRSTPVVVNGPYVIAEAEDADIIAGGWKRRPWNETLYASTFSNTFTSRRMVLAVEGRSEPNATVSGVEAVAQLSLSPPLPAGEVMLLVRYGAPYMFEVAFDVSIVQDGKEVGGKRFGLLDSPKVWAFRQSSNVSTHCGPGLQPQCRWSWSATENWVWERANFSLPTSSSPLEVILRANQTEAPIEVDAVMVSSNFTDFSMRLSQEQQLPLDGVMDQNGEVFARGSIATGSAPVSLSFPYTAYHSSYSTQHLICVPINASCRWSGDHVYSSFVPVEIDVSQGGVFSEWVNVGGMLGSFNDMQWLITATKLNSSSPAPLNWTVEFGRRPMQGTEPVPFFATVPTSLRQKELLVSPNIRGGGRIRESWEDVSDMLQAARSAPMPPNATSPKHIPIYGYTTRMCPDGSHFIPSEFDCGLMSPPSAYPQWNASVAEFHSLYTLSSTAEAPIAENARSYVDLRRYVGNVQGLVQVLDGFVKSGVAESILVVSLGDEISLARPKVGDNASDVEFAAWAIAQGLKPQDVNCSAWGAEICPYSPNLPPPNSTNFSPYRFFYSNLFAYDYGAAPYANATAIISQYLPRAKIGANFSPLTYSPRDGSLLRSFLGDTFKYVTMFQRGDFSMGWSEGYLWTTAQASPQVMDFYLSALRAGLSTHSNPLHSYVMAHNPGQTPLGWRRMLYTALKNGAQMINLYEFRPVSSSYTENYVGVGGLEEFGGIESYQAVRTALGELSLFDDIVIASRVWNSSIGVFGSLTGDLWLDALTGPSGAQRRTIHADRRCTALALAHAGFQVDTVTSTTNPLSQYTLLFVNDVYFDDAAASTLLTWVEGGGVLLLGVGAAQRSQFNQTLHVLTPPLTTPLTCPPNSSVTFPKQDLIWAEAVGSVLWRDGSTSKAIGCRQDLTDLATLPHTTTTATFGDNAAPAIVEREIGSGKVVYFGFSPGLSAFYPAMPRRPADRGATDAAFTHFIPPPSTFSPPLTSFLSSLTSSSPSPLSVNVSGIASSVLEDEATEAIVILLVDWSGRIDAASPLAVEVELLDSRFNGVDSVLLASGGGCEWKDVGKVLSLQMAPGADAIIFRRAFKSSSTP